MLLVHTKLGVSKIEGIGCFAAERIPKGSIVWKYNTEFDIEFGPEKVESFPEPAKEFLKQQAYLSKKTGNYILCPDNAHFFNHSDQPTVLSEFDDSEGVGIAAKDIEPGEEITENYKMFDKDFNYKMSV